MIAVIQRVSSASVVVDGQTIGVIARGLAVLAAVHRDDAEADLAWMAGKLAELRLFPEADKAFHLDVNQIAGGILLVSNFTVAADARKGRRPSLDAAAPPDRAAAMFDQFVRLVRTRVHHVETGKFGADMQVHIVNDGPITIVLDSRSEERLRRA